MATKQPASFRVLMFPWLAHAHVSSFLELSRKLSSRNFHIYFCSTPIVLDSIRKDLNQEDSSGIELVELRLPSSPPLPPRYHATRNTPPHLLPALQVSFQKSQPDFYDIIADLRPDLLIYDVWQPWSAKIASSLGIPSVHFAIEGSASRSFYHHAQKHGRDFDGFPSPAVRLRDYEMRGLVAEGERAKVVTDKGEGFSFGVFQLSTEIALVKSCRAVEGKFVDHLSALCGRKIVPTGPLVAAAGIDLDTAAASETHQIMEWLSKKSRGSTLYISFGSDNYFSKEQIAETAKGLEIAGVSFIWVARSPPGSDIVIEEALPVGFLERVGERGMVVRKWAPQAAILAHPSVGGFMSHCGWSSVVESVYFGVPVVAVPLSFDQPLNARLVVEMGVGVEVVRDGGGGFDGEGVARAVDEVFGEESGEGMRRRVREMSEKMKMEVEEDMGDVVEELKRICLMK